MSTVKHKACVYPVSTLTLREVVVGVALDVKSGLVIGERLWLEIKGYKPGTHNTLALSAT